MALVMALRDATGIRHPEAYWRIDELDLDYRAKRAQVRVSAFHDQSAAKSKNTETGKPYEAVGQRWYYVEGEAFDRYFGEHLVGVKDAKGKRTEFANPRAAAYHFVKADVEIEVEVVTDRADDGAAKATKMVPETTPGAFEAAKDA